MKVTVKTCLLPACLVLCLSSCGLLPGSRPDRTPGEEPSASLHVGQIASIHSQEGFVLIRRLPSMEIASGTILISTGPTGQVANLRVTGESLGQMIAADIQSGCPQIGDSVSRSALESDGMDEPEPSE